MIFFHISNNIYSFFKGENNIRWIYEGEEPKFVVKMFSKIVKILRKFRHCKIVIASMIPSPVSHQTCHEIFQYVNKKLRKMCQKYSHTSFLDLDNIFLRKEKVKMSYFKKDLIHFNTKGSKALAKAIKNQLL